jgi:3-deoxy-D-manno-octulosonate 8-phosphate phosphatase (KDO 8-P phosphatase)
MGFDVDGVFTDGTLLYGTAGDQLKAFNILDGLGLKLLHKAGIHTAIITARQSPAVLYRFEELGIHHLLQGREDKGHALLEIADTLNCTQDGLGFMGDDYPDLTTLPHVAFFASVPNAPILVQEHAQFVSTKPGGQGAVREVCEHILRAQGIDPWTLYQESA